MNQSMKNALAEIQNRQKRAGLRPDSTRSITDIARGKERDQGYKIAEVYRRLEVAEVDRNELAAHYGITLLDSLTTEHLSQEQAAQYNNLLSRIRQWRQLVSEPQNAGRFFVLASPEVGIGKTHMAQAVFDSFGHLLTVSGKDEKQFVHNGKLLKPKDAMALFESQGDTGNLKRSQNKLTRRHKVLVLDDIGREGIIQYVSQQGDGQLIEKRSRYFALIDFCYSNGISVFMTTNYDLAGLEEFLGKAVWSRIQQRTAPQHLVELRGFPDFREIEHVIAGEEILELEKEPLLTLADSSYDPVYAGLPTGDK